MITTNGTYLGEHYYFENEGANRRLVATYNEAKAGTAAADSQEAWFYPYGDTMFEVLPGDILLEIPITSAGQTHFRADLSIDFLVRNGINPLPALAKLPIYCASWEPYRTRDNCWEQLSHFPQGSAISGAIQTIQALAHTPNNFTATFEAIENPTTNTGCREREFAVLEQQLKPLIAPNSSSRNDELIQALENALPQVLPKPTREDGDYEVIPGDPAISDRTAWRWRLLYALAYGVALGKLSPA